MVVLAAVPMSVTPTWTQRCPSASRRRMALLRPVRALKAPVAMPTPRRVGVSPAAARRHRDAQPMSSAPRSMHSGSAQLV